MFAEAEIVLGCSSYRGVHLTDGHGTGLAYNGEPTEALTTPCTNNSNCHTYVT
jgi:hypothetical protein